MASGIYQIENMVNGKFYIGSSVNTDGRHRGHIRDLQVGKHPNMLLQRAWTKYGEDAFVFEVLLNCPNEELIFWEQLAIDAYREWIGWENMYNICPTAGSQLGFNHSQSTKERIRKIRTGSKASKETKKRMCDAAADRAPASPETRARLSAAKKKQTAETKAKIGAAHRGKVVSQETREKQSLSHKNPPQEIRDRISAFMKTRPVSDETRAKLRAAIARRREKAILAQLFN